MPAKEDPPLWLQAIHRFERAIGVPVESAVRSDAYFDFMTEANRVRARLTRAFEETSEELLHRFNLPAGTDVRRLREQLARVERQLTKVAKDLADLEQAAGEPRPTRSNSRPTAAKARTTGSKPRKPRSK
jgi:hypothetical protein